MKNSILPVLIVVISFCACNHGDAQQREVTELAKLDSSETSDITKIEALIREVYVWHESGNPSDVGAIPNEDTTQYIALNLAELDLASEELAESDFFTADFISNFENVHTAIDQKLKNKEIEWFSNMLPPFGSGANEWCNCQDVPFDYPNPWRYIDIEKIKLTENSGEFQWKWGRIDPDMGSGWNSFRYRFKVEKVNGKWQISYLEGFEFDEFTRVWKF